jgi:hypothetical protein
MRVARVHERFMRGLEALMDEIKRDRSVLAAILGGSLAHDTVWARSDIDLVLITIDHHKVPSSSIALDADGANVHAALMPRAEFRRLAEGVAGSSFMHSFLTKGRLLYTHDETIARLCQGLAARGARDTERQLFHAATSALPALYKAHKWFLTRGDLDYTALWILYAATSLAQIEVLEAGRIVDREALPQAMAINPAFFKKVYSDLLNEPKTVEGIRAVLEAADGYLECRLERLFAPLLDHLREVGDTRSCTDLEDHFAKHFDIRSITTACEYLADQGVIGRGSVPVRLTKQSNVSVQELAFFHLGGPGDE